MPQIVIPVKTNSVRFAPIVDLTPDVYNQSNTEFDQVPYAKTVLPTGGVQGYEMKVMFGDTLTIMMHTLTNPSHVPSLELLDYNQNVIGNFNSSPYYKGTQTLAYNTYGPSAFQMDASLWSASLSSLGITSDNSGIYYCKLTTYDPSGTPSLILISEPILLNSVQSGTKLIQSSNNTNRASQRIIIDGWASGFVPTFAIRAEADIQDYNPTGIMIGYQQQDYEPLQLNAQAWRTFTYSLGSVSHGVPNYLFEMVAECFNCDNLSIDGQQYIYDNGGNSGTSGSKLWKKQDPRTSGLITATCPIRYPTNDSSALIHDDVYLFASYISSNAAPYAVYTYKLTNGVTTISLPANIFYTSDDDAAYLVTLNGLLSGFGLVGNFTFVSGAYYYNNAPSEGYWLQATTVVMTEYMSMQVRRDGTFSFQIANSITQGFAVIDWGTGVAYTPSTFIGTPVTVSHFYGTIPAIVTFNLFFSDATLLEFTAGSPAYIQSVSGTTPVSLQNYHIINGSFIPTTTSIPISNSLGLQTLILGSNNIAAFSPPLFAVGNFSLLNHFNAQNQQLSSAEIDALFNEFVANTTFYTGITPIPFFNVSGQSPAAPPTSASATARATLIAAGWTVITD